jgi:hypothetical protein
MADSISPTGEWSAVMAANPVDKVVYYYMEGMIAPMGSYPTYGRVPRAVGVVDRSVRETAKGVYTAKFQVPKSGDYDVAFLIDSPWVDHCFSFSAEANPSLVAARKKHPARIEYLTKQRITAVGAPYKLSFSLTGSASEEPLSGLRDVIVMASRTPGWQRRHRAQPLKNGRYEVVLATDQPGAYYVSVAVPSLNLPFNELPFMTFRAVDDGASKEGK